VEKVRQMAVSYVETTAGHLQDDDNWDLFGKLAYLCVFVALLWPSVALWAAQFFCQY
jgi:hypothetical protein